jgi:hypothetical protein
MLRRLWQSTQTQTHTHALVSTLDFIYRPVNTFSKLDIRDNNVNTEWCLLSHYYGRRRSGIIIYRVRVNLSFLFVSLYYIHSIPLRHFKLTHNQRRRRSRQQRAAADYYTYNIYIIHVHSNISIYLYVLYHIYLYLFIYTCIFNIRKHEMRVRESVIVIFAIHRWTRRRRL